MHKFIKIALIGIALSLVAACGSTAPIMNVDNTAVMGDLSKEQVRKTIITAAANRGWVISDTNDNELQATLNLRTHQAVVRIPYSEKAYSIVFVSAKNLDEKNGKIHPNYNRWVNNLNADIRRFMQIESLTE